MKFVEACKEFLGLGSEAPEYFDEEMESGVTAIDGMDEEISSYAAQEEEEPLPLGGFISNRRFAGRKTEKVNNERPVNRVSGNLKVVLCNPVEYDNCPMICGHLRSHMTVVLNLEQVKSATEKRRIFDFVSGCCFALDCNIRKISEAVYVVAPSMVDLLSEVDFAEEANDASNYFDTDYDV